MNNQNHPGEVYDRFVLCGVDTFLESCNDNAFDSLRALQRIKADWTENEENKGCRNSNLLLIVGVEALLLDIAEAEAAYNLDLLKKHEQSN
ncbi:MAG: hypothetical protein WCK18_15830 [Prolixibacteraceae bacterium]